MNVDEVRNAYLELKGLHIITQGKGPSLGGISMHTMSLARFSFRIFITSPILIVEMGRRRSLRSAANGFALFVFMSVRNICVFYENTLLVFRHSIPIVVPSKIFFL